MDKTLIGKHYELIDIHYPGMNIAQLGMVVAMLGVIRSSLGHEGAKGTIETYIHKDQLSKEICQCIDFLEREVIGIKKSKIDVDFWKRGREGAFRRDEDLAHV